MRILFVVPYVPSLIRVRPYNLIRHLAEAGHDITLVTLYTSEDELNDLAPLRSICTEVHVLPQSKARALWNCLLAIPARQPLQSVYSWNADLARLIQNLTSPTAESPPIDVIHIEHLRGARYGLALLRAWKNSGVPDEERPAIVWDSVDCISQLFNQAAKQSSRASSRLMTGFELSTTRRFEASLLDQFERILVTSHSDKNALLGLRNGGETLSPIRVVTNGVDLDYFTPDRAIHRHPNCIVVSGKMSYHANTAMALHLVEDIMPMVWAKIPDIRVFIVGKDPPSQVSRLANDPRVTVTGTVKDIRNFLRMGTVAVSPIVYGAGIQNKILEAMACETPVITSHLGASALQVESGRELVIANNPQSFAASILELISNPEQARQLAARGRKYVLEHHDWRSISDQLVSVYHETLPNRAEETISPILD